MTSLSASLSWFILFIYAVAISSSFLARAHEQNGGEEMRSVGRRFLLGFKESPKGSNVTFECSPSGPCVSCNSSEKDLGFSEVAQYDDLYCLPLYFLSFLLFVTGTAASIDFILVDLVCERRRRNIIGAEVSVTLGKKRKEKYRCSETGYRIPFKCKEVRGESSHKKDGEETQNDQSNVDDEEVVASAKPRNLRDDSPASKVKKSQSYKTYRSCVPSADEEKVSVLGFEACMLGLLLISGSAIYLRKKQTVPMLGVSNGRSQSNSRF